MRKRVLIVDDYADARELLAFALEDAGYETTQAADGAQAIAAAIAERPDVVLMDLAMPGMDGIEASRRLRDDARTRDIPIVVVTGQPSHASGDEIYQLCRRVLYKPVAPSTVVRVVDQLAR